MQGDAFGCPYKTLSPGELADALRALRLPPAAAQAAVAKARGGHFQLACMAAWEGAHGCACDTGINHPNQVSPETLNPEYLVAPQMVRHHHDGPRPCCPSRVPSAMMDHHHQIVTYLVVHVLEFSL